MVELNEKALEAARNAIRADDVGDPLRLSDPALDTALGRVIHAYLSTLPAPDDGLVERGVGIVRRWADWIISISQDMDEGEWPGASRDTVKADRDAVITALQSQAMQARAEAAEARVKELEEVLGRIDEMLPNPKLPLTHAIKDITTTALKGGSNG